jgi:hypothetical protein
MWVSSAIHDDGVCLRFARIDLPRSSTMYESAYPNDAQLVPETVAFPAAANFSLFNSRAVTLATFFGTPAAGAVLMALNYRRLGEKGHAAMVLAVGITVTGLAIALAFATPSVASYPMGIGLLLLTRLLAERLQGKAVALHVSQGGRLASKWVAFAVGAAFFVLIFLSVLIPVYAQEMGSKVKIGENDEVFFTGSATRAEAQALGTELKADGYFKDRGTTVFLDKGDGGTTISMVVKDGVWERPGILMQEEEVAREVATAVGGLPIHVKVVDKERQVRKQGIVGRVSLDAKDEVFYFGDATAAEATALDKALQHEEYFSGRGASVMFSKDSDGKAISFVVSDGFWDDPAHVSGFEAVVKAVAPAVGGLPMTLKLVNTSLDDKKDVVVK